MMFKKSEEDKIMKKKKIVDLSIPIESGLPSDPPNYIPYIDYRSHKDTAEEMLGFFGEATKADLPEGNGWAVEFLELSTHSGTHVDAPYHYYPTMNNGERSWTIDEVPLEWFHGPAVVVNFIDKPDGYKVTPDDFKKYFKKIDYDLKEGDVVLINTGASKNWGSKKYLTSGCGMSKKATLWLIDKGVRLMGTDAWSWDRPLSVIAEEFNKTHNEEIIWEGHRAGANKAYCHIEKLTNLEALPTVGSYFYGFPVKIKDGSAGWIRAVAFVEDE